MSEITDKTAESAIDNTDIIANNQTLMNMRYYHSKKTIGRS